MKKLLVYLSKYKKEAVLGPAFKLLEALFELFVPFVVAKIVDEAIAFNDKKQIVFLCGILAMLGIVGFVFSVAAQFFSARAAVGLASEMRMALFKHIQKFSFAQMDKIGTSTLLTRMTSDINQVQTGINLGLRLLLRSPFVVFGTALMAFSISPRISVIFFAVIVALSAVVFGIMFITMPMHKKVQSKLDSLTLATKENLSGVRVIRAFCKEDDEIRDFSENNDEFVYLQKRMGKFSALTNPLTQVIVNIGIIILIYNGTVSIKSGLLTQGALIALYNYMSQILVELVKLVNLIVTLSKSGACMSRISAVLEIVPENTEGEKNNLEEINNISFKDVSFCYDTGSENSLTNISFSAEKGQSIGILGGTGDGKTTLINLIARYYKATSGKITVNGENIDNISPEALRDKVCVVFQRAVLFSGTIRENLLMGNPDATDEDLIEALKIAQAYDFVEAKSGGLDCIVEQEGRNFSGGQKQRLTIARAIVKKPSVLILDDSSSALDYLTESKLRAELSKLSFKPLLFIVSQRASSVMNADMILVLEDGKIAGHGTHEELIKNSSAYREIYQSQFGKEENL